jgi:hypothetical protein
MKTNNNKIMKSSLNQSNLDDSLTIKKNMLGYYLAGLIEGDGSIIVPKTIRNQKGKLLFLNRFMTSKVITSKISGELISKIKSYNSPLNPDFITGFTDAEGSFSVSILKRHIYKTGWSINPVFTISLHNRDTDLLYRIQSFFGLGKISFRKKDGLAYYTVNSINDFVNIIIPHFDKYPLLTKKQVDYEFFKIIINIMYKKEHLNLEGLQKVINLKSSMNKGSTPVLLNNFPNLKPLEKVETFLPENLNSNWILGFIEGEGCFSITTIKSNLYKTGYQVQLNFNIVQHSRDILLMKKFINFFHCGNIYKTSNHVTFAVTKLSDIEKNILSFFEKYELQGYKLLSYKKFHKVLELMKKKVHLTNEGLEKIILLITEK